MYFGELTKAIFILGSSLYPLFLHKMASLFQFLSLPILVYLEPIFSSLHIQTPGFTQGPFLEEGDLEKVYLKEPTAALLAKLLLGEGPRLSLRHQAPCGTSQASCRYLLPLWTRNLLFCQQSFSHWKEAWEAPRITWIFFSLKHKLFFLRHWVMT